MSHLLAVVLLGWLIEKAINNEWPFNNSGAWKPMSRMSCKTRGKKRCIHPCPTPGCEFDIVYAPRDKTPPAFRGMQKRSDSHTSEAESARLHVWKSGKQALRLGIGAPQGHGIETGRTSEPGEDQGPWKRRVMTYAVWLIMFV
jgi:hypothetical protein